MDLIDVSPALSMSSLARAMAERLVLVSSFQRYESGAPQTDRFTDQREEHLSQESSGSLPKVDSTTMPSIQLMSFLAASM